MLAGSAHPSPSAVVGAIRWDGWYRHDGLAVFAQQSLAPADFRDRAPLHCISKDEELTCVGGQNDIDLEIMAAAQAGLTFWAFDWASDDSPFHRAWHLYQSSHFNSLISWCPIVGLGDLGSPDHSTARVEEKAEAWALLMTQATYFDVTIADARRPLLFILYREDEMKGHFGSLDAMKAGLNQLRAAAARAGAGDPYVVLLDPSLDKALFSSSGADAVSNYIAPFRNMPNGSYAALDVQIRAFWEAMLASGQPMIPIVQVGWDVRPEIRQPMPWNPPPVLKPGELPSYYVMATPESFADEVLAATRFVVRHADACPSRVVLAYSWDECNEGGCIMPTLGDPQGRYLAALSHVLGRT